MRADIDRSKCIGSGMCAAIAPEAFELDDEDRAVLVPTELDPEIKEAIANAAACCPVDAIVIED